MPVKLPRLPVNWKEQPQLFERYWDEAMTQLEKTLNAILDIPLIEDALSQVDAAVVEAQAAASAASASAAVAQESATGANAVAALTSSGVTGITITAADAGSSVTITISGHTRTYGDGSSVAVLGDTLTGRSYSTSYYIYYDDPARTGGTVSYQTTTNQSDAIQAGDRHLVGVVTTPAAAGGPEDGFEVRPPGLGNLQV